MKQKLLLVSAAMLFAGTTAFANWTDDWTYPTVEGSTLDEVTGPTLDEAKTVYLFNIQQKGFAGGANSWGTRASVTATGDSLRIVYFESTSTYGIYDYLKKGYWSPDSKTGIWIDGGRADYSKWAFLDQEKVISIMHPTLDMNATLGCLSNSELESPELNLYNAEDVTAAGDGVTNYDTWKLVTVAEYTTIIAEVNRYKAAISLKAAIDEATAAYAGIDLTSATEVLNNASATTEEIQAAEASIADIILKYIDEVGMKNATVDNPLDITSKVANADGATLDGEAPKYWKRVFTGSASNGSIKVNTWSSEGASDGTNMVTPFIETWVSKGTSLSDQRVYRDTVRLAPGAYKITGVMRFYNESGAETISGANMFANLNQKAIVNDELGDKSAISAGTEGYFTYNSMLGYYAPEATTYAIVAADSALVFGYTIESGNFNWMASKNYKIYYLGDKDESYAKVVSETSLSLGELVTIAMSEESGDEPDDVTQSLAETWNTAYAAYAAGTDVKTNYATLYSMQAEVESNMAAWASLRAAYADAATVANNASIAGEDKENLGTYLNGTVDVALYNLELSVAEINAMIEEIVRLKNLAVANGLQEGAVYDQLVNADFSNGTTGWSGSPTVNQSCGEKYGCAAFDVYQEVENAPVGCYEITMQGFYRKWRNDGGDNYSFYQWYDENGNEKLPHYDPMAYVYLNDHKTPLKSIYEEDVILHTHTDSKDGWDVSPIPVNVTEANPTGDTLLFANTMTTAAFAFGLDMYKVSAYGVVAKKGDKMRIGVKGNLESGAHWAIFDNFKLIYRAKNATIVKDLLTEAIADLDLTDKVVGKNVIDSVSTVKTAAETALAAADGDAMFEALSTAYAMTTTIEASEALFDSLSSKFNDLETALTTYAETASTEAVTAASALYAQIQVGLSSDGRYTDEEARAAMTQVEDAMSALKVPAGLDTATDDNPFDLTQLINTPGFEKDNTNSVEGWNTTNASGYNFGNDDAQKAALALEYYQKTYNLYQDITGLPAGTYKVGVNAFYRYTNIDEDQARNAAGETGLATMYAVGTDSIPQAIRLISTDPSAEALGAGTETNYTDADGNTCYVPNDMVSSRAYFTAGHFVNELIVKVGEDGKLRIGIQQTESVSGGWLIMDDWTLVYYGANSSKEQGALTTGIEAVQELVAAESVEIFNLNGQRINSFQPGMNIVRTNNANGSVSVRKVYVK